MSWGRLDDKFWCNPKKERTSYEAQGAFWDLNSYACFCGRADMHQAVALKRVGGRADLLSELVEVGFLEVDGDSYRIHDWEGYQAAAPMDGARSHEIAQMGGLAKHEKYGTRAPACDKCKRWKRRCPEHKAGAKQPAKQPTSSRQAADKQPASSRLAPASPSVSVRNQALSQGALPDPDPVPDPDPTVRAVSGSALDRSRQRENQISEADQIPAGAPDEPSELRKLFDEWYRVGGPTKESGRAFKENFGEFEKAFRKSLVSIAEFKSKVRLRLACFEVDDRPDRSFHLGMIRTFLVGGKWREQEGPPETVAPLAQAPVTVRNYDI